MVPAVEFLFSRLRVRVSEFCEFVGSVMEGPPNEERQEMKINPALLGRQRESFWD